MPPDSSIDSDIANDFAGTPAPVVASGPIDSDIAGDFGTDRHGQKIAAPSGFWTQLGHAGLDIAGSVAHGAGTLVDVARNDYRVLSGEPTIPYGSPDSTAAAFSRPFEHAPDYEQPDIKEQIRRSLPKLGDQPIVKNALDTPLGQTLSSDVIKPAADIAQAAGTVAGVAGGVRSMMGGKAAVSPEFADPQSMGAAHAPPDFSTADPDIQAAMAKLSPQEIEANRPVLERHAEAQSLPVKMRLTEGQATGDPDILSDEMNNRGATGLSKTLNTQGQQLKDNLQAMRENVGPDVYTTNPVEHGQALIDAYKAKDAPIQADINAKYAALRDAAGGEIPIDGQTFVNNARTALRKSLLSNNVPPSIASDMEGFARGDPMNFEDFESMRTNLAQEMRDNPSGNARRAAGIVRQSLEDLPLQNGAEALKPLADAARSAAKARFSALEADPAYDAAVNDKVPPDQFVNKFVTGTSGSATKGQAAIMKQNLSADPTAIQTMGVATVDELKKAALGVNGEGNFANVKYNNRLESLRPKINELLPADATEAATKLGNVARYIKAQPEGTTINNSNTLTGALAQGAGHIAKSVANVKTGGLAGPVIDYVQGKLGERALSDKLETATAPLAGVKPRGTGPTLQ